MPYFSGFDFEQLMYSSWNVSVDEESIAGLIDVFVNSLDLKKHGVKAAADEGHPSYDPRSFYKLYIYGGRKWVCSSRKLAENYRVNLRVKRILEGAEPYFRTILNFRKNSIDDLKGF